MKPYFCTLLILVISNVCAFSQSYDNFFEKSQNLYQSYFHNSQTIYDDFRNEANKLYVEFLKYAWKLYGDGSLSQYPNEDMLPPVIIEDDDVVVNDNPIEIEGLLDVPIVQPQPIPPSPIRENPVIEDHYVSVMLYGTIFKSRFPNNKINIVEIKPEDLAVAWGRLSSDEYNNTINDCLKNRSQYHLSDWAYLRMIDKLCAQQFGASTNTAELVKAYIFSQSGYKMRLAVAEDKLVMLYGTPYIIYGKLYWEIDGEKFYCDDDNINRVYICEASFPGEQALSTAISMRQDFPVEFSSERSISSNFIHAKSKVNTNYIDFCNDFPTSQYGNDPMTRWAIYANTPTSKEMTEILYPHLKKSIENMSKYDAVNHLCNWVQTAFVYEYDDKVWGVDRAFFADESLYYPYCDCEDRSILLTRIVRDILGLECALVYYPGHLATAIAIGEDAKGDYLRINNKKFLVCDPTYINAPIGLTMPGMDNSSAKVIVLK